MSPSAPPPPPPPVSGCLTSLPPAPLKRQPSPSAEPSQLFEQDFVCARASERARACCQVHWWQSISIWAMAQYNYRGIQRITLDWTPCAQVCVCASGCDLPAVAPPPLLPTHTRKQLSPLRGRELSELVQSAAGWESLLF